ncbi:MAG: SPFH domain-containing protein [Muribaculaceae bacterium]|nr:SPFH domain-containing protein [Bacteroidales bacterium]MDY5119359.1 SPFH domain-containing protein [Muribaculaceae bacterium]
METKERVFKGFTMNGFLAIAIILALVASCVWMFYLGATSDEWWFAGGAAMIPVCIIFLCGFGMLEPNEIYVMVFFGKYVGTYSKNGFFWTNPFLSTKKLTLRARNLDVEPIKVNDKVGNPIMIGLVMVWKLKDAYKAMFEVDAQSAELTSAKARMNELQKFVRIQSDAALREVAGQYAYDDTCDASQLDKDELTLRSGGDEINVQLEHKLNERLAMAGIEVVEARLNYLAYAPEIAAAMLRRQQAAAVVSAREKIVEGAVSMVKLALDKLAVEQIELDEEKRAAMVSNLLVVLCSDESAQPVVNAGTLNH